MLQMRSRAGVRAPSVDAGAMSFDDLPRSHGPYLEMFARSQREGWDAWGNETAKFEAAA